MRQPEIYNSKQIKEWSVTTSDGNGIWRLARPEASNHHTFMWRWHLAWLVLTGKCDVLAWGNGQ